MILVVFLAHLLLQPSESVPACDNPVFCQGPLLETVQNASIFSDSKEFVDRPLLDSPTTILAAFGNLSDPANLTLLKEFVKNYTAPAGSDLETWDPPDWVPRPQFVDTIKDDRLRQWAIDLNDMWRKLGRKVNFGSDDDEDDRHSLINLPYPFIIPGGRFREIYYWDTYWILRGLLLCEMKDTARGMIENMAYLVQRYGLVPNGGRQYYTRRSQPPLLTQMVELYYNTTENSTFLQSMLPALVTEYHFWVNNRSSGDERLAHYRAPTNTPRPESYRADIATAEQVPEDQRDRLYQNIASAAESGWDFSTRWLAHTGSQAGRLPSIRTDSVLPVDLNAILCSNTATLSRLFRAVGNETASLYFENQTLERWRVFNDIFWNDDLGVWRDRGLDDDSLNGSYYASSFAPLIWRCGQGGVEQDEKFLSTLNSLGVLDYPGGVPTSLWENSTQQWDFPNAWAPLQWMLVEAWHDSSSEILRDAAEKVAKTWLTTTFLAWEKFNNTMFEKYNCIEEGQPGGGGEYDTQDGFGWTNGVALQFLALYPDIDISPVSPDHAKQNLGWVSVIVLAVVGVGAGIPCVLWCRWIYTTGRDRYWGRVRNEHLIAAQGGISHSRSHSRPQSPTTYTNRYAHTDSSDMIYDETLLEFDV